MTVTQASLFTPPAPRIVPLAATAALARPVQRPYQVAAREGGEIGGEVFPGIVRALDEHSSALLIMATGTGKTVVFAEEALYRGGAIVCAHRDSLIRQAASKLQAATGERVAIEKAERYAFASNYVVASVQTLKGARLAEFAARFQHIPLLVFDEGHRGTAKSYRAIRAAFPNAKALYVTATADRGDGVGMHNVCDVVAYRYDVLPAIEDGWLCPIESRPVACDVNLDGIKLTHGDLDQVQLDEAISRAAAQMGRGALDSFKERQGLIFTPGVKTAHATAMAMNELRPGVCVAVDGEMDDETKLRIEEQFTREEIQAVSNCGVYVEGFDYPRLKCILDAAPTKSRLRYSQKVGRVTRPWPGIVDGIDTAEGRRAAIAASVKPTSLCYDLACNGDRHKLAGPLDLLAGKCTDEEIKAARKILKHEGGDVLKVLAEARAMLKAAATRAARAAYTLKIGVARSAAELYGIKIRDESRRPMRAEDYPTGPMVREANRRRIQLPRNASKGTVGRLIGEDRKREAAGLCNMAQIREMASFGLRATEWPRATFHKVKAAIVTNHWRPLPLEHVDALLARTPGAEG